MISAAILRVFSLSTIILFAHAVDVKHVVLVGSDANLQCHSNHLPVWMRQSITQQRLHAIATGDKKQPRFDNDRLVNDNFNYDQT